MLSPIRVGKFTSSEIYNLMAVSKRDGKPLQARNTYITEKKMESRLGKPLNSSLSARPTIWGHVLEMRLNTLLDPFEYQYVSSETIVHPTIPTWAGTPDWVSFDRVVDGKCPYTLKAFCELADISIGGDYRDLRLYKPEYYWQLVSNAILTGKSKAELITYCPYHSELEAIRELIENENDLQNKYAWIYFGEDEDLPHLIEGNYYKNKYHFVFDVPQEDIDALTQQVITASKELEE